MPRYKVGDIVFFRTILEMDDLLWTNHEFDHSVIRHEGFRYGFNIIAMERYCGLKAIITEDHNSSYDGYQAETPDGQDWGVNDWMFKSPYFTIEGESYAKI